MEEQVLLVGICDDKEEDITKIADALQYSVKRMGQPVKIHCRRFLDGESLYNAAQQESFHLIFLDIMMPGLDGFAVADMLCLNRPHTYLIFVSAHESYVFDSAEYMPLWFVRKARLEWDMFRAVQKYFQLTTSTQIHYRLRQGYGYRDILISSIIFIEGSRHTLVIHQTNGKRLEKYGSLKSMEEELSEHHFLRIHKNYLVNQEYIEDVGTREIYLKDGSTLEMGRDRRITVREAMLRYEKEKHGN